MNQVIQSEPVAQASQPVRMGFDSLQSFELIQRAAKLLASSQLVPKEYQGNLPNCVIALNMANRIGADPLMVMQNLVIVHGKPTWSSQFLIATVNTCGRFTALRYEFFGEPHTDSWGCRAWATEKFSGEKLVGTDITIDIAKTEGWYGKNGSKWKTIPQQMLMYRAGAWWARSYAPELSMGLQTADEVMDIIDVSPTGEVLGVSRSRNSLNEIIEQAPPIEVTDKDTAPAAPPEAGDTETVQTHSPSTAEAAYNVDPETGEVLDSTAIPETQEGELLL